MMKSFSKFNMLKEKMNEGRRKSLLDRVLEPKYKYLKIEVPYYDYLRGKVLLDDMSIVVPNCPPIDISLLVYLLYIQFLFQVRAGTELKVLSQNILSKMDSLDLLALPASRKKQQKLANVSPNLFTLQEFEVVEERKIPKEKIACITLRIKTSEIYRGEILLNDIFNLNSEYQFTVERIITMLYMDFIQMVKRVGNERRILQSIIHSMEQFEEYL